MTTIRVGDDASEYNEIAIPKEYGISINIGDTRGPSGIFRFLRVLPPLIDIVKDIERYCPDAIYLNYTNPMAMVLPRAAAGILGSHQRIVPQRSGHGGNACPLDRRAHE